MCFVFLCVGESVQNTASRRVAVAAAAQRRPLNGARGFGGREPPEILCAHIAVLLKFGGIPPYSALHLTSEKSYIALSTSTSD